MAAVIGDFGSEPPRFHNMIATSGLPQYQSQHSHDHHYRSSSRSRDATVSSPVASPGRRQSSVTTTQYPRRGSQTARDWGSSATVAPPSAKAPNSGGASRFPSPPDSSWPSATNSTGAKPQNGDSPSYMASSVVSQASSASQPASSAVTAAPATRAPTQSIPSPASDSGPRWNAAAGDSGTAAGGSSPSQPAQTTVRIRDLAHIQSLAQAHRLSSHGPGILNDPPLQAMKYEISAMPIGDIIEMVAALLTKITTTNDLQHDALNRNATHMKQAQAQHNAEAAGGKGAGENYMSPLSSSVLAFHGKNVPAITILSYLTRIHKYCPTTYEVFLSLLVYFDRMTERVNEMVMKSEEERRKALQKSQLPRESLDIVMSDESPQHSDETDEDLADDDDSDEETEAHPRSGHGNHSAAPTDATAAAVNQATYFVVDSFNIHRLIIAGVTCASKFFSDVFYTNSRYAKVGGLPLAELNHLELQFLLLNDFRLAVPVEDLEAYATMLVEFYAREVAQR